MWSTSVLGAKIVVDFENRNTDSETDEEELLLLLQPGQLHPHSTLRVIERHLKVPAAVVEGQCVVRNHDTNG